MYNITSRVEKYNEKLSQRKRAIVFVFDNRPLGNGRTVGDDFIWRRKHQPPIPKKEAKNLFISLGIFEELKLNPDYYIVTYSRKAGCPMCPCSPGYIIRGKFTGMTLPIPAFWLSHKDPQKEGNL